MAQEGKKWCRLGKHFVPLSAFQIRTDKKRKIESICLACVERYRTIDKRQTAIKTRNKLIRNDLRNNL